MQKKRVNIICKGQAKVFCTTFICNSYEARVNNGGEWKQKKGHFQTVFKRIRHTKKTL